MLRFSKFSFTTTSTNPFFFSVIITLLNVNKKSLLHQFFFYFFFKFDVVTHKSKSQPHSVSETQTIYTRPVQVKEKK